MRQRGFYIKYCMYASTYAGEKLSVRFRRIDVVNPDESRGRG